MGGAASRPVTFDDVLDRIRAESENPRQLGERFERIMLDFFKADRHYRNEFGGRVYTWKQYAKDAGIDRPDEGIDLVAIQRDGTPCGIQCKCYADDGSIDLKALGTFVTACGSWGMKRLILVYTGDHVTEKAEYHLRRNNGSILTAESLRSTSVDWSGFPRIRARRPLELRDYQTEALRDTVRGFGGGKVKGGGRRGQLIMACGTGKTLTSLRIAERVAPKNGVVLYLVPSITLIAQSMRAWSENRKAPQHYLAVCSDTSVGGGGGEEGTIAELESAVSTDPDTVRSYLGRRPRDRMTVIFCTYNSIQAVADAMGGRAIDLALCDEAHRTIGGASESSYYTKVHEDSNIRIRRRLYMTATPKIFTDRIRRAADAQEKKIYAMDDEKVYGPVFHTLNFTDAVHRYGALSDYRVRIAFIPPKSMDPELQESQADEEGLVQISRENKIAALWHSILHPDGDGDGDGRGGGAGKAGGGSPILQRVIVFSNTIRASKWFAGQDDSKTRGLPDIVGQLTRDGRHGKTASVEHVDGKTRSLDRKRLLRWLEGSNDDPDECRLLSNARCLSEGVDVPALDGVVFMEPRKSEVDVVQSVGRVMRKSVGKRYGYVVIPVAIPAGKDINETLDDGTTWKTVWQVLNALRSHDPDLAVSINKLALDRTVSKDGKIGEKIRLMAVTDHGNDAERRSFLPRFYSKMSSTLVRKVGDINYYGKYGQGLGRAAHDIEGRIRSLMGSSGKTRREMESLHSSLQGMINGDVTMDDTVQTVSQHMVMSRVFDALFRDEFTSRNPVSDALARFVKKQRFDREVAGLDEFYADARRELEEVTEMESRQEFIKTIYENFFRAVAKKETEQHGIVYTPVPVIDFILDSVRDVLASEFGTDFADRQVKVLDPFTGTGTFISRLLECEMLGKNAHEKYRYDLHANEMILLAYYVAAVNIETTYSSKHGGRHVPFEGINYTDTLGLNPRYREDPMHRGRDTRIDDEMFRVPHRRVMQQQKTDLDVIVGNPPYSAGQSNYNDQNQNIGYEVIDDLIRATYLKKTKSVNPKITNVNSLYDSYIRSIRWASSRIGKSGIIGFVTNASFIRSEVAAGIRACLKEEFTDVWVFDLRGNARTQGEMRKKEGGNVFGLGSRAPVAITILVRNPKKKKHAIHYCDIGDRHSQKKKLDIIGEFGSIKGMKDWEEIKPDRHHDWLDQREGGQYAQYLPLGSKDAKRGKENAVFGAYSRGIATARDTWAYSSSEKELSKNMKTHIEYCRSHITKPPNPIDPRKGKWDGELSEKLKRSGKPTFTKSKIRSSLYRPFFKQHLYFDRTFNVRQYQIPKLFPQRDSENIVICVPYKFTGNFSAFVTNITPDLELVHHGQCFPLYIYENGTRVDNITNQTLREYRDHYGDSKITKRNIFHYVYGLLHHPGYRKKYANNLSRGLPRIPMAPGFRKFSEIGKKLADLHLSWETCKPHRLGSPKNDFGRYAKMAFAKKRENGKTVTDPSALKINGVVAFENIPDIRYRVNGRTPLEWAIDRYEVTTDRESGITNDPTGIDPIELVERLVHVGVESDRLVSALPKEFEPKNWKPQKAGLDRYTDGAFQSTIG